MLIVLILILVGIIGYLLVTSGTETQNKDTNQTQSESSTTSTNDIGTMASKVRMEMSRAEVDKAIGSPYECQDQTSVDEGAQYSMQRCQYGDKNAEYYFDVMYMNGKVWGTTAVKNVIQ